MKPEAYSEEELESFKRLLNGALDAEEYFSADELEQYAETQRKKVNGTQRKTSD